MRSAETERKILNDTPVPQRGTTDKNYCGPQPPGSPERAGFARDGVEAPPAALDKSRGEKQRFIPILESTRSKHCVILCNSVSSGGVEQAFRPA